MEPAEMYLSRRKATTISWSHYIIECSNFAYQCLHLKKIGNRAKPVADKSFTMGVIYNGGYHRNNKYSLESRRCCHGNRRLSTDVK